MTENVWLFVRPIVTDPKFRVAGVTTRFGGLTTTMRFSRAFVLTPTGPLTRRVTSFEPGVLYVCVRTFFGVSIVAPSPKSQKRLVIVPVEVSVNVTVNGHAPFVGVAVKLATGTMAAAPVTGLVELPPLALV